MLLSNLSILTRFILVVALITLIISVGVSVLGYRATLDQMESQLELQLKQDIEVLSLDFKNILKNLETSLSDFALNHLVANALVDDQGREVYTDRLFDGLRRVSGVDIEVSLVNYRGDVIAGASLPSSTTAILTPAIKNAIAENNFTLWGINSAENGSEFIMQAPIIFANTGLPEGALVYRFLAEDLFNTIVVQDDGAKSLGFIRTVFFDFEDQQFGHKDQLVMTKGELRGEPEIIQSISLPVQNSSLSLNVSLNADRALFNKGYTKLIQSNIIFGLATFIFSIVIAYPLGRILLDRLTEMQLRASEMVKRKDFRERFPLKGHDEISLLAAAFNNVLSRLELAYSDMETVNERLLKEQAAKYQAVISQSTNAMLLWDSEERLVEVNQAAIQLIGSDIDEIKKMRPEDIIVNPIDATEDGKGTNLIKNSLTGTIEVEVSSTTILIGDHPHSLWMVTDLREKIATQKLREEQRRYFEKIAHRDDLTKLPNRRMLNYELAKSVSRVERNNGRLAVCYIDLDGFKEVNDSMGHEAGDQVLIDVAKRLSNIVRPSDMVARLGGDEFVLLLEDLQSDEQCLEILGRVLETLKKVHQINDKEFMVGASIGVTVYPMDDNEPETLLRHADQAMYVAKQKGRNRYHFFNKQKLSEV